jgi:3-carboxy-cis,cis-muconate cycloisomerase
MRRNLELTNGLILSERVASTVGGDGAHDVVREAALASVTSGRSFEDELRASDRVSLSDEQLAEALDPATYIGSAEAFVDRALVEYRRAGAESS